MTIDEFKKKAKENGWAPELIENYIKKWESLPEQYKKYYPLEKTSYIKEKAFFVRALPCE